MKLFIKKILNFLIRLKIIILFKFRLGRFLIDKIIIAIFSLKKTILHNKINLTFHAPNRMNFYRIQTFSTKEPETLEWIDSFEKNKVFWDIGANIGDVTDVIVRNYNPNIYCYEPNISCYNYMLKRFKKNSKIKIFNVAVSNFSGKTFLYFHKRSNNISEFNERSSLKKEKDGLDKTSKVEETKKSIDEFLIE